MKNPWTLDPEEIPDDAGIGPDHGHVGFAGAVLWGSLLTLGGALLVTDLASGNATEIIATTATVVASVALVVALGWLAYFALTRFTLVGQVLVGLGMLAFLFFVLPFLWQLLLERTDLMAQVSESLSLRDSVQGLMGDSIEGSLEDSFGELFSPGP